jgi:adenylylsulfate kinase-like enzyme
MTNMSGHRRSTFAESVLYRGRRSSFDKDGDVLRHGLQPSLLSEEIERTNIVPANGEITRARVTMRARARILGFANALTQIP